MTKIEQKNYWKRFHKTQMRYERMYEPRIRRALKNQVNKYFETNDLLYVTSSELYEAVKSLHYAIGPVWAAYTNSLLRRKKARMPMGFSPYIVSLMRSYYGVDLLNDCEGITDTTKALIQRVLVEAAETGWSIEEIVSRIDMQNAKRARLIARTESVAAANAAAVVNAKDTGLDLNKIWIAAYDNRTRLHHSLINQTIVPVDDYFKVGEFSMAQPGDRSQGADGSEVCNCRCCIAFIEK